MSLKKIHLIILAFSLSFISCKTSKQETASLTGTARYTTVTDITEDDIRLHIGILASDSMRGRMGGTQYEALAAEYIKGQFESFGLKAFDNNYYQSFSISTRKYFDECELNFDGYSGEYPEDFRSLIMFDSLTVTGDVVFAGYGNDSDYENLDVKNKWVIILENDNSILYINKSTAKANGAIGVLAVGKDGTSGDERYVRPSDSMPLIRISHKMSDQLFANAGTTVSEVLNNAKLGLSQNIKFSIPVTATIKSKAQINTSQNVVAYVEASDSGHKNEYIVIGAHYDHIGTGKENDMEVIYYGADDNASGVAGLLELAEKIYSTEGLKYNFIFTAFGAEELGLVGSRFFCDNPPVPLEDIKLMVNLDMIGRMDSRNRVLINTGKPDDRLNALVDIVKDAHPDINTTFSFDFYMQGSDHTSFYNNNIPVLYFLTGLHGDYHRPTDTIDAINYRGAKLLLDFVYDLVISPAMDDCIRSFTSSGENP